MPRAVIIEFTGASSVSITTANGHGNTVRSTFLAFAPAGWDADVIACPNDFGVAAYNWIADRTATYSIAICSNIVDVYYTRNIEKVQRVLGIPLFFSMNNSGSPSIYEQGLNAVYTGAGTTVNIGEQGYQIMTFDTATNLTGANQTLTSFTNAVVAGKCAALVDSGLTAAQIWMTVRQQGALYPAWSQQNGYGKAPASYSVPESYAPAPVLASEMWRSSNTLNVVFTYLSGTTPTAVKVYRNGVLDGTYAWNALTTGTVSAVIGSLDTYRFAHNVVSDGGTFTFTLSLVYAEGESTREYGYAWVVSGFADNFEPPDPDPVPPEPEPEPEPPFIPGSVVFGFQPQYLQLFAKSRKALSLPVAFENGVNVQLFGTSQWLVKDSQSNTLINVSLSAINATTAFINADASTMNVNAGTYSMTFEGFTGLGWQPFAIGSVRIDRSV